jgi:hypothetical protein
MAESIPSQWPEEFPSSMTENGMQQTSGEEGQRGRSRTNRSVIRKSTGPRTARGKQRSKFNARKHGLYSKVVLLNGESRPEYDDLLKALMEYIQPKGVPEIVEVQNLANLYWRRGRLLLVETAEIAKADSIQVDSIIARRAQTLESARRQGSSDGMRDNGDELSVVRNAMDSLVKIRQNLEINSSNKHDGSSMTRYYYFIPTLSDELAQDRMVRVIYEIANAVAELTRGREGTENAEFLTETLCQVIDEEVESLADLYKVKATSELQKIKNNVAAARMPSEEASDRIIRCEAHLSREIDRTLNRIERLQRIRKGQPLPPQVDVKIS